MNITAPGSVADIHALLGIMPGPAEAAERAARDREGTLTKPPGALGRLEDITAWLAAWQDKAPPRLDKPRVVVFAGNHGVAARGVSAYPAAVTAQMVANFQTGGAAVNQLAKAAGASFEIVALDLDRPTGDIAAGPAMDEADFVAAFNAGFRALGKDTDLLAVGEMGIANTTVAAALAAGLFGGDAGDWVGRGTGVDGAGLSLKREVVGLAVDRHKEERDPIHLLRRLGGRELAAMAGAVLAARLGRVPVLLDGYVATAAAAALERAKPGALDHALSAHVSAEPGHRKLLAAIGKTPLLDLGMRLGEASGAALAINLVRSALACHTGMATFADAGVSDHD